MIRPAVALAFVLVLSGCRSTPAPVPVPAPSIAALQSADLEELARLEDARSLGEGRIEGLTRAPSTVVRERALLALARLQVPRTAGVVAAALDDPEPGVRSMAAFALGQLGLSWDPLPPEARTLAEGRLLERLKVELETPVRAALVEALGKVGTRKCLDPLVDELTRSGGAPKQAALALALLAKNSANEVVSPRATLQAEFFLRHADPELRFAAAYLFMRYREPNARGVLKGCLGDSDAEVRATCVKGLADVGADEDVPAIAAAMRDADGRVGAEAARTLAKLTLRCGEEGCPPLEALDTSEWSPAQLAAVVAEPLHGPAAAGLFARKLLRASAETDAGAKREAAEPGERATQVFTECRLAFGHDRALGRIERLATCGGDGIPEEERLQLQSRALGEARGNEAGRVQALASLVTHRSAKVRAAAISGLAAIPGDESGRLVLAALGDPDPLVAGTAAEAAETRKLQDATGPLVKLLTTLDPERDTEALQAVISAATALSLKDASQPLTLLASGAQPVLRSAAARALATLGQPIPETVAAPSAAPGASEALPDPVYVRLVTTAGTIRFRLLGREAPQTSRNFLHLVRKRFYDGLSFHRIVPGFVSQGGDPRGDGSGGPGHAIRCEINRVPYRAGSVGMALSGKDTGGSQFFIAHTAQPHLDGRYTVFGEVIDGFEVALKLIEGDRILEAREE